MENGKVLGKSLFWVKTFKARFKVNPYQPAQPRPNASKG